MDAAELAARFAPILWIHETDHHLPEDWRALFDAGTVQLCHNRHAERIIRSVEDFLAIPPELNTAEHALDIAELNLLELTTDPSWTAVIGGVGGQGLECVREGACKGLGNNRHVNTGWFNPARAAAYHPRVYWRAFDSVAFPADVPALPAGTCQLVQYFFYTIYNDHFNQHEGDWDATLQMFVSDAGEPIAATYSFHEDTWLLHPGAGETPIMSWLDGWENAEAMAAQTAAGHAPVWHASAGRDSLHPWVFIASGSHGAYPTPGYTTSEAPLPAIPGVSEGGSIRLSTDDRAIGQTCIFPSYSIDEATIRRQLRDGGVTDRRLRPIGYTRDALEQVDPVNGFAHWKGHWGERVDSLSWSGPQGPTYQEKWQPGSPAWIAYLQRANRFGNALQRIGHSVHGVRPHDRL